MIKIIPLKTKLNPRDSIYQLYKKDGDKFCETIRREGFYLYDRSFINGKGANRFSYFYHSGYIININMLNGDYDEFGLSIYKEFSWINSIIEPKLKELKLI